MLFEGLCQECDEVVEYVSSREDRDDARIHRDFDMDCECPGELKRVPFPRYFAVKWAYGGRRRGSRKKTCFMGPTNNTYKTDTTRKSDIAKTRTVHGPYYKGKCNKNKKP